MSTPYKMNDNMSEQATVLMDSLGKLIGKLLNGISRRLLSAGNSRCTANHRMAPVYCTLDIHGSQN